MSGNQSEGMVVFVLIGQRVAILPMDVHEDRLDHNTSVGMVKGLLNITASSHSYQLFSLLEIDPFVFEEVLHSSTVVSDRFIVHIFVVDVGCSC